jgi:hypothetical protein
MSRKLDGSLVASMREAGQFRTEGFRLHADFVGEYSIDAIVPYITRNKQESYRMDCKSKSGVHSISGFMVNNCYVLPKNVELKAETVSSSDAGVFYYDGIEGEIRQCVRMNHYMEDSKDFEFPEKLEILGAVVSKDQSGKHPYVPLSRYPMHSLLLKHHQKLFPEATFVTRDEIEAYIKAEGDARPNGLPKGFKFELPNHEKSCMESKNWTPTLIVRDWHA